MEGAFCFRETQEWISCDRRNFYNRGWGRQIKMNKNSNAKESGTPVTAKGSVMAAATDLASETIGAAHERLNSAVETGQEVIAGLRESAAERAKAADRAIRKHPYRTMVIAAGLGALVGFLLARGRDSDQ